MHEISNQIRSVTSELSLSNIGSWLVLNLGFIANSLHGNMHFHQLACCFCSCCRLSWMFAWHFYVNLFPTKGRISSIQRCQRRKLASGPRPIVLDFYICISATSQYIHHVLQPIYDISVGISRARSSGTYKYFVAQFGWNAKHKEELRIIIKETERSSS